jgi:hypothetical protein
MQSFILSQISSTHMYANGDSIKGVVLNIALGVIITFMAPLITTILYPQPDAE